MPGCSLTCSPTTWRRSATTEAISRPRTSIYTQPEGLAFSLLSMGGPSLTLIFATVPRVIWFPSGV
ncbi:hypothetical protein D3C76_1688440 [compost metagenome]